MQIVTRLTCLVVVLISPVGPARAPTDIMLSDVQFSLKIVSDNKVSRVL